MMIWKRKKNICFQILLVFSIGYKIDIIFQIGTYQSSIFELQNMKDRSLVKITKDGYVNMHKQLIDMGQKIAMEQRS